MAIFRSVYAQIFLLLNFVLPLKQVLTSQYDLSVYPSAFFYRSDYQPRWWQPQPQWWAPQPRWLPPPLRPSLTDNEMCIRCAGGNFCKTTSHSFCLKYGSNYPCNQRDVRKCNQVLPETNRGFGSPFNPEPVCSRTGSHCSYDKSCCESDARCDLKSHMCCKPSGGNCILHADCCGLGKCRDRKCCQPTNAKCTWPNDCCSGQCSGRQKCLAPPPPPPPHPN